MMNNFNTFLALDTSTPHHLVLVLSTPRQQFISSLEIQNFESSLIPAIEDVLDQASIEIKDIDAFVLGAGPGSFMGLRLGFSVIRTWAWIYDTPITVVSSLDLLINSLIQMKFQPEIMYVPCIDGKMQRVFANITYQNNKILSDGDYFPDYVQEKLQESIEQHHPHQIIALGSGVKLLKNVKKIHVIEDHYINNTCFSHEFLKNIPQHSFTTKSQNQLKNIEPHYLRVSAAEMALSTKKQPNK